MNISEIREKINISWPVENLGYEQLIIIPLIIGAVFGSVLAFNWASTGSPVPLSLEFSGGSFIRIENISRPTRSETNDFQAAFKDNFGGEVEIHRFKDGMEVETSSDLLGLPENQTGKGVVRNLLTEAGIEGDPDIDVRTMGSIITQLYKSQARNAAIAAFIAMAILLYIALRKLTAVGSILSVVGLDFLGIIAGMAIFGIQLSLASMAGILLIFGYAVNTNILLSTNVLRRKGGTPRDRAAKAMSTGVKMSSTSATAMIVLNLVTTAPELQQISAVLVIGILVDMLNTWLLNSGILLRHKAGGGEKYHGRI